MAETESIKTTESLSKDKIERNGMESINDSGIEMNEEKEKIERNLTLKCPWILGQLAWARGSSYPFWPCVVTLDPTTLLYFKVQNKGRSQAMMIHVQYFGDGGRHNWVLSHYMIPFTGLEDFKVRAKSITPEIKKKEPKFAASFTQKMAVKKQWGIGVTEASGLMHLSNEDRASIFEPPPPVEKKVQLQNMLKRKLSPKGTKFPSDTTNSTSKKFKKIENDDQSQTSESIDVSNLKEKSLSNNIVSTLENESNFIIASTSRRKSTRNQNKNSKETIDIPKRQNLRKKTKITDEEKNRRDEIDFDDYYNLNKDFWKADYPESTDEEIKKLLQGMWNEMDIGEKRNNLNRKYDELRYNSNIENSQEKRIKKATLNQEKENSKNSENAQHESNNKNTLQQNGKNVDETMKNKVSSQKEKNNKKIDKDNVEKEKNKISSDIDNEEKEKNNITSELIDENNTKEENKITSNDENVENEKSNNDVNIEKEKTKIITESNDKNIEKEENNINSEINNDNIEKKIDDKSNLEISHDLKKGKKDGNKKSKNSAKNGKIKDVKKKNNSEKEDIVKEINKEKKNNKVADEQSVKG